MSMSASEREALARRSYEKSQTKSVELIASEESQPIPVINSLIEWYRTERVAKEAEESEARGKWRTRTEEVWAWVQDVYESLEEPTMKDVKDLTDAYAKLAKLGIDLDALAKEKTLNVKHYSKMDLDIEELLGYSPPAEKENDLPI